MSGKHPGGLAASQTPSRCGCHLSLDSIDEAEQYDAPENYIALNEVGAPPPIHNTSCAPIRVYRSLEDEISSHRLSGNSRPRTAEKDGKPILLSTSNRVPNSAREKRRRTRRGSHGEYNAPADFGYLTELQPELPVENPDEEREFFHDDLERDFAQLDSSKDSAARKKGVLRSDEKGRCSQFLTVIITISHLVFFSILGTLARLGLTSLTTYTGAPVTFPDLWSNVGGTFFLGFLTEGAEIFRHPPAKRSIARSFAESIAPDPVSHSSTEVEDGDTADDTHSPVLNNNASSGKDQPRTTPVPLHIGLATGFCGSFTTFSGFIRECFETLSNGASVPSYHPGEVNSDPATRRPGQDFMAAIAVIIATISLSVAALKAGAHLAIFARRLGKNLPWGMIYWIDRLMIPLALCTWAGAIVLSVFPPDRPGGPQGRTSWTEESWRGEALFALVFGPAGCLLRFFVSIKLNRKAPSFPLGTFIVNMFGTMVMAIVWDLQRAPPSDSFRGFFNHLVACQVLQGISDGFCGCLTTISTWAVELSGLRRKHAYVYGFTSVSVGLAIATTIMGSLRWTVGIRQPICTAL